MKRAAAIILQFLVTAAGIFYVFHDPAKRSQIGQAIRQADWHWLMLGWLCYSVVEILATVRWQMLLRVQGITLSWLRAGGIVLVGLFFNMFLPGLVGGDVVRLYYVFKSTRGRKTRAVLSVAMDRLFGLLSILFLAALTLVWRFSWLKSSATTLHITYFALLLLGGGFVIIAFIFFATAFGWLEQLPRRFPFRHSLTESGKALTLYGKHPVLLLGAFLLTVVSHLAYYVTYFCAGESLHRTASTTASLADVLAIMPIVNTLTALPISFGGVGVRETLFQELLGRLAHVPASLAALSATLGFAIQASWSILGAVPFLFARKK